MGAGRKVAARCWRLVKSLSIKNSKSRDRQPPTASRQQQTASPLDSSVHSYYTGVQPLDPLVGAVTAAIVLATAAIAAYLPARQAARVDPVIALRAE
jgi:ABC-type antimicrobial peptide transport system permease subunit